MPSNLATLAIRAAEEIDFLAACDVNVQLERRWIAVARKRERFLAMVDAELAKLAEMRAVKAS